MRGNKYLYDSLFVLPGDKYKSETESLHFHRGESYEVTRVFTSKDGIIIFFRDKYGNECPKACGRLEPSTRTQKEMYKRMQKARMHFWWNNHKGARSVFHKWDRSLEEHGGPVLRVEDFYEVEKAHFGADSKAVARITKYVLDHDKNGPTKKKIKLDETYFYSEQDFIDYLMKNVDDVDWKWDLAMGGRQMSDNQQAVDLLTFVQTEEIPVYKEGDVTSPFEWYDGRYHGSYTSFRDIEFDEFLLQMSDLIFDNAQTLENGEKGKVIGITKEVKDTIRDIMILYRDLPKSHSGTSVSKILTGKSKAKISTVEEYVGRYRDTMSQTRMFELATRVESFLYQNRVFSTKEDYSSGEEWRGQFEFIGSKYVDNDKLQDYLDKLS